MTENIILYMIVLFGFLFIILHEPPENNALPGSENHGQQPEENEQHNKEQKLLFPSFVQQSGGR